MQIVLLTGGGKKFSNQICSKLFGAEIFRARKDACLSRLISLIG